MCRHITLLLPNRPGEFFKVAKTLGDAGVNIIGFHLASERLSGILQLICDDQKKGYQVLRAHYKYYCTEREVLAIKLRNEPGQLSKALELLQQRSINLANAYQFDVRGGNVVVILEFESPESLDDARDLLSNQKFQLLAEVQADHEI